MRKTPRDGLEERVARGARLGDVQLGGFVRVVRHEGRARLGFFLAHPAAPQGGGRLFARGARDRAGARRARGSWAGGGAGAWR